MHHNKAWKCAYLLGCTDIERFTLFQSARRMNFAVTTASVFPDNTSAMGTQTVRIFQMKKSLFVVMFRSWLQHLGHFPVKK